MYERDKSFDIRHGKSWTKYAEGECLHLSFGVVEVSTLYIYVVATLVVCSIPYPS
jgi:hypothetical protein